MLLATSVTSAAVLASFTPPPLPRPRRESGFDHYGRLPSSKRRLAPRLPWWPSGPRMECRTSRKLLRLILMNLHSLGLRFDGFPCIAGIQSGIQCVVPLHQIKVSCCFCVQLHLCEDIRDKRRGENRWDSDFDVRIYPFFVKDLLTKGIASSRLRWSPKAAAVQLSSLRAECRHEPSSRTVPPSCAGFHTDDANACRHSLPQAPPWKTALHLAKHTSLN